MTPARRSAEPTTDRIDRPAETPVALQTPRDVLVETSLYFETGAAAGRRCAARFSDGSIACTWRNYGGVAGAVASLARSLIVISGVGVALLLANEGAYFGAVGAIVLSLGFAFLVAVLGPNIAVTLLAPHGAAVLSIRQLTRVPGSWLIMTPAGERLALVRRPRFHRARGERWFITDLGGRVVASFRDRSSARRIVRLLTFGIVAPAARELEFVAGEASSGQLTSRGGGAEATRRLDVTRHPIDARITLAAAALILTGEP